MKIFLLLLFLLSIIIEGCVLTRPDYKTEPTQTNILKTDKEQLKESIRLQKEHAKAAERKRKELEKISHKERSDNLQKSSRKKK